MKPGAPELDRAVDTSHERLVRVDLLDHRGQVVDELPVVSGQVLGSSRSTDRWSGTITLPVARGDELLVPTSPTHPLSGFAGYSVRVWSGAVVDRAELLVPVARLWPFATTLTRSAESTTLAVDLVGPMSYAQQSAGRLHTALPGESCQTMIERVLLGNVPHTPAVHDTTTPDATPDGYESDADAASLVEDLSGRADIATYFDAAGDLVMREPLPGVVGAAARALAAAVNVTGYTVTVGRDLVANDVRVKFAGTDGQTDVTGVAAVEQGPLGVYGPAGRITQTFDRDIVAGGQVKADRYARSVLAAQLPAWVTVDVQHLPDPRLEPDDLVTLTYLDGTTALHRVVSVVIPLGEDGTQTMTARTAEPIY